MEVRDISRRWLSIQYTTYIRSASHLNDIHSGTSDEVNETKFSEALHEDKECSKEEQCPPLHLVQDSLQFLYISQQQQGDCPKQSYPA